MKLVSKTPKKDSNRGYKKQKEHFIWKISKILKIIKQNIQKMQYNQILCNQLILSSNSNKNIPKRLFEDKA
jgi:hypothetical protein